MRDGEHSPMGGGLFDVTIHAVARTGRTPEDAIALDRRRDVIALDDLLRDLPA
jgi:hypothetical protein